MNRSLMLLILGMTLILSACEKKEEAAPPVTSAEDVQKEAAEITAAKADQEMLARNEFVAKTQQELDELNVKLVELKDKAKVLTGEAKAKIDQQVQNLEQEQKTAAQKLDELKAATGEKWNELKAGVSATIERTKKLMEETKDGSS